MGGLTLNQDEQGRLETLNRVLAKELRVKDAACLLGVSERHTWRLLAAYRREGASALVHRGRGRRSHHALPVSVKDRVIALARGKYNGVNHTHLTELLAEREGLVLSRSTVRRILVEAGMGSPRTRRRPRCRLRRERLPREGMLVQIDGSDHDWLEDRGPRMCLLLAVDDATGCVPWALFQPEEDSRGYLLLVEGIVQRRGIPLAVYSDRHSVFRKVRRSPGRGPRSPEEGEPTQFGRAMRELGVVQVFSWGPEGKGRVERVVGTLQDRLVSELRLAGATTLGEANEVLWAYLPRYNQRFSVPAAESGDAYRAVPRGLDLEGILCFKHRRKVARDNTVRYQWRTLQLVPETSRQSHAGLVVEVREHLDGALSVVYKGQTIPVREVAHRRGTSADAGNGQDRMTSIGGLTERLARFLSDPEEVALAGVTRERRPTPRKIAYWEAIQEAESRGLGVRAIARELGISRNTVRKYLRTGHPPFGRRRRAQRQQEDALTFSLTS